MANWNQSETLGNQYLYVSKNGNDTLAANYFGKAAAWVANNVYAIGDRVTSVSIQYYNKTGVNTATAPASDSTNWGFDKSNFGVYATAQVYGIGDKTNYSNEHYVCTVSGSTGTFQPSNWTKVVVSNKDYPYLLMNTAIVLINADARFVSYELLDYPNNKAYYKIHILVSNGIWSETLTSLTKYTRVVGQSKWKTIFTTASAYNYQFLDNVQIRNTISGLNYQLKFNNCVVNCIIQTVNTYLVYFIFCYKNIFLFPVTYLLEATITHFCNNTLLSSFFSYGSVSSYSSATVIKNNYFASTSYFFPTTNILTGNFDYNKFVGTVYINYVAKSNITDVRVATPNQNLNSSFISLSAVTFNNDYTLPANSPLLDVGYGGVNIGAENRGYNYTTSTLLDSSSGATYRNITKSGTMLIREQVNKFPQAATSSNITLQSDASSVNETYTGFRIKILDGLGINQTRLITAYDGSTKVATIGTYSGSSATWDITPDQYSIYEILDGEVISAIGDLGGIKNINNFTFLTNNIYDMFGKYTQSISYDNLDDGPDSLNFYLRSGMGGAGSTWRRFNQEGQLMIDTSGRGSGDVGFDANNITTTTIPMRYFQIKIQLHKN